MGNDVNLKPAMAVVCHPLTNDDDHHAEDLYPGAQAGHQQGGVGRGSEHVPVHQLPPRLFQSIILGGGEEEGRRGGGKEGRGGGEEGRRGGGEEESREGEEEGRRGGGKDGIRKEEELAYKAMRGSVTLTISSSLL